MKTQILAISKIDHAISETNSLMTLSSDPLLPAFLDELNRYRELVESHWPLDSREKSSVDIGRVAVRELDETFPTYVGVLCSLGAFLREEVE